MEHQGSGESGSPEAGAPPVNEAPEGTTPTAVGGVVPASAAPAAPADAGPAADVTVELYSVEAAAGAVKTIAVPPDGRLASITIAPGVVDGALLRVPGLGAPDPASGVPGELMVRVRVGSLGASLFPPVPAPRRSRKAPLLVGAAALAALLVLVGGAVLVVSTSPHPAAHAAGGAASASASPSPTPATPEDYQAALDYLNHPASSLTAFGAAHTAAAVSDATSDYGSQLILAEGKLDQITPPAAVSAAHRDLVLALGQLSDEVDVARNAGAACGGSSALADIASSPEADAVRTAVKEVATADPTHPYTIVNFVPPATPATNRQLANGTIIKKNTKGANVLKVVNKGSDDLVLALAPADSTATAVMLYVRAGQTGTVNGIHDGTYNVFVTAGSDWDAAALSFTRGCDYLKFDAPIALTSTSRQYSIDTLTLGVDSGGNAPASRSDANSFPT